MDLVCETLPLLFFTPFFLPKVKRKGVKKGAVPIFYFYLYPFFPFLDGREGEKEKVDGGDE